MLARSKSRTPIVAEALTGATLGSSPLLTAATRTPGLVGKADRRASRLLVAALVACSLTADTAASAAKGDEPKLLDRGAVSGTSPLEQCNDGGIVYTSAEVEPAITVDPTDPGRVVVGYQQDRSDGVGSLGVVTSWSHDGGTFRQSLPGVSSCGSDLDRVGATSLSTGPDGAVYLASLAHSHTTKPDPPKHPNVTAITVSVSYDGGTSWPHQTEVARERYESQPVVRADPHRAGVAYLAWGRHNIALSGEQSVHFATTANHGRSWTTTSLPAPPVITSGALADPVAATPAMFPAGILPMGDVIVVVMTAAAVEDFATQASPGRWPIVAARVRPRADGTVTASPWEVVATLDATFPTERHWRDGSGGRRIDSIPFAAAEVDGAGNGYVVWPDRAASTDEPGTTGDVRLTRLRVDEQGTLHWTLPEVVASPGATTFLPAVAVASDGTIGVTYHDLRDDRSDDEGAIVASAWFSYSRASAEGTGSWHEAPRLAKFDLLQGVRRPHPYLGNSTALVGTRHGFWAALVTPNEPSLASERGLTDIRLTRIKF